jgi:hypothetical protein
MSYRNKAEAKAATEARQITQRLEPVLKIIGVRFGG